MQPLNVLLVEDNPGDADLTRETLEAGERLLDISVVVDGEQAMDFLLSRHPFARVPTPDLIVLDLNLPRMNGREVLAAIKTHDRLRIIPIVILTSSDAERDIIESYALGANCYVTKPLGLVAFQAVVTTIKTFWFTVVQLPGPGR